MNQWAFVTAAYVVVIVATGVLGAWSWMAMRRHERAADALKDRR